MNVLMVGMEWLPNRPGGLNRYFHGEVYALAELGITGSALVTSLEPGQSSPFDLHAMSRSGAGLLKRVLGANQAARRLLAQGFDVVNPHFALYAFPWVNRIAPSVPCIVNFQGPWADEMLTETRGIGARVRSAFARRIETTLSESFQELVHSRYGVLEDKIRVIPGGVNLRPYLDAPERPTARRILGWPLDRKILLCVRRLSRRMGLENLIDAMTEVKRARPEVLLFIGGSGPLSQDLDARVERLQLRDHVRFLGFIPDMKLPAAYAAANLTVVPTIALEGFGLVTVESLASGTPVMGTAIGGTPEILEPLNGELLFKSRAPSAITEGILAALSGSIELPDRETCRCHAHQYGWPCVAPRIISSYETALSSKPSLVNLT
jgi:glycosyltransferase involved in cell wall biosynthesis